MKDFSATYGLSEELDRVQRNIEDVLLPVTQALILDGNLLTADITTAGTLIPHKLGRAYKGLIVVKRTMPDGTAFTGTVTEDVSPNSNIYIKLDTTVNVTVTVWVF